MNIPKGFKPKENLDEGTEELRKERPPPKVPDLNYLIYEGVEIIEEKGSYKECAFDLQVEFGQDDMIGANYITSETCPGKEKKKIIGLEETEDIIPLDGTELALRHIYIYCKINDPLETIEKTFFGNPPGLEHSTCYWENKFILKDQKILKKKVDWEKEGVLARISIGRIACKGEEEGIYYNLTEGELECSIKNKIFESRTMKLWEVLPFTKKEKEILSNFENFNMYYRFSKPNHHILDFGINKKKGMYRVELDIKNRASFDEELLSSIAPETIWPAKNLFNYLNLSKKIAEAKREVCEVNSRTWEGKRIN